MNKTKLAVRIAEMLGVTAAALASGMCALAKWMNVADGVRHVHVVLDGRDIVLLPAASEAVLVVVRPGMSDESGVDALRMAAAAL